jgi:hypothetical protein
MCVRLGSHHPPLALKGTTHVREAQSQETGGSGQRGLPGDGATAEQGNTVSRQAMMVDIGQGPARLLGE